MKATRLAIACFALAACSTTPPAQHGSDATSLASQVMRLDRQTSWLLTSETPLAFDTHHPQGMVRIEGDTFLTSVEIIQRTVPHPQPVNGMDRDAGKGIGHLFRVAPDGSLKSGIQLGEGDIYHPGGLDFDGRWLWIPVAEYRPDSRAIIYRVDPDTLEASEAFRFPDHIGAVAFDRDANALIGASWGGARIYRWPVEPDGTIRKSVETALPAGEARAHYIAWQDCHGLPRHVMICSGLSTYARPGGDPLSLGGIELIDTQTLRPLWQTPILLWSPSGRAITQNPAWFEGDGDRLRAWFIPDDGKSTLFTYEADLASP